ncbi:MAG: hypothetical protein KJO82_06700 [Gammaproteobacteria bacterium]|nr:hypothetical protein [Gammaproteobacteria bacterium]
MKKAFLVVLYFVPMLALSDTQSPYAGQEHRAIKSLSEDEIRALQRGDGMGFAKLAELNQFPGPKHVLAVADKIGLSDAQRQQTAALFEEMRANAIATGVELIEAEARLDRAFAERKLDAAALQAALIEIAGIRARLRYVHLEAHLRQTALLDADQIRRYDAVRGYHRGKH